MIYIGSDHRGFDLKQKLKEYLTKLGYGFEDLGAAEYDKNDDYPDYAEAVCKKVITDPGNRGIVICGSDIGVAIAANKIRGIRAGGGFLVDQIKSAVVDDNINVLALAADYLNDTQSIEIVKAFLETKFSPDERHIRRIKKIDQLEKQ